VPGGAKAMKPKIPAAKIFFKCLKTGFTFIVDTFN
jgi:hypothetical protein